MTRSSSARSKTTGTEVPSTSAMSEVPLYAAEDVAKAGVLRQGFDSLIHMTVNWIKVKL